MRHLSWLHAASLRPLSRASQLDTWFQLARFWATNFHNIFAASSFLWVRAVGSHLDA
jgi:hypothetical protein